MSSFETKTNSFLYTDAATYSCENMSRGPPSFRADGDTLSPALSTLLISVPSRSEDWQTPSPTSPLSDVGSRPSSQSCVYTPGTPISSSCSSIHDSSQPSTPVNSISSFGANSQTWNPQYAPQVNYLDGPFNSFNDSFDSSDSSVMHRLPFCTELAQDLSPCHNATFQAPFGHQAEHTTDPGQIDSYGNLQPTPIFTLPTQTQPLYATPAHGFHPQVHFTQGLPNHHVLPSQSSPSSLSSGFASIVVEPDSRMDIQTPNESDTRGYKIETPGSANRPTKASPCSLRDVTVAARSRTGRVSKSAKRKAAPTFVTITDPWIGVCEYRETQPDLRRFETRQFSDPEREQMVSEVSGCKMHCNYATKEDNEIKRCASSFHRGEHYKRHLFSHLWGKGVPKPFHCDVPGCEKAVPKNGMVRGDNTRQHYVCHLKESDGTGQARQDSPVEWSELKRYILCGKGSTCPLMSIFNDCNTLEDMVVVRDNNTQFENLAVKQVKQLERTIIRSPELWKQLQHIDDITIRDELKRDITIWNTNERLRGHVLEAGIMTIEQIKEIQANPPPRRISPRAAARRG